MKNFYEAYWNGEKLAQLVREIGWSHNITRSHTPSSPPSSCDELTDIALSLRERVNLAPRQKFRLVGVGLSNFQGPEAEMEQSALFE